MSARGTPLQPFCEIRYREVTWHASVEFENGKRARFYNEE